MAAPQETAFAPAKLTGSNPLVSPTWNRLDVNETAIYLPAAASVPAPADAIHASGIPQGAYMLTAFGGKADVEALDVARFDAEYAQAAERSLAHGRSIEYGVGKNAQDWMVDAAQAAGTRLTLEVPAYRNAAEPVVVRLKGADGCLSIVAIDLLLGEGAGAKVVLEADSPADGAGVVAATLRVVAKAGAHLDVTQLQTLDDTWTYLDSIEVKADDSARITVDQTYLGGKDSYAAVGCALEGAASSIDIQTGYLGTGAGKRDFNYLIRHYGRATTSELTAHGVLTGASDKVLRGTIDLVRGAKGAHGHELETVLLANDDVRNRTVPIILCDEDEVQGDHGATIGHVPAEQRLYLRSRGLDDEEIEALFIRSAFETAAINAFDDASRTAIERLGARMLSNNDLAQEGAE